MLGSRIASLLVGLHGSTWPKHAAHCLPVTSSDVAVVLCAAVTDLLCMQNYLKLDPLSANASASTLYIPY